uniref:Uncharacterized protein n=1 Tax=Polynucleobacter necessarius subsp. necessarius (strain STIR1) TaxID=452638 RepID=B1XSG4_POLNS
MNDLFSRLQNVVVGFSSESELNGAWTCTTYDADSSAVGTISGAPAGSGARSFVLDSVLVFINWFKLGHLQIAVPALIQQQMQSLAVHLKMSLRDVLELRV